jgi:hypothetical protein
VPAPSAAGLSLEEKPATRGVELRTQRCKWGKVPNFLAGAGMPAAGASSVAARVRGRDGDLTIEPPPGSRWSDFRWLEVEPGRGGFASSRLYLQDRATPGSSAHHQIVFKTIDGSPRPYAVPVSSCAQWYGYGSAPLRLASHSPQPISAVRLIR